MSVASSEYTQNPLSTITSQFTSQMNTTPAGTKKSKINRKRGFNELDLPFDDNPPSKKHRLTKQANSLARAGSFFFCKWGLSMYF